MRCCANSLALTSLFFFFNDTATTEIYTLSLHDALPISGASGRLQALRIRTRAPLNDRETPSVGRFEDASLESRFLARTLDYVVTSNANVPECARESGFRGMRDRKSTRLNSSHLVISYAV